MSFDGLLIHSCTIQLNTPAQNSSGQFIDSWADSVTGVKCRIDALSGGETRTPTAIYEKATHTMFMRNSTTITLNSKDHRIVLSSANYNILVVNKMYGGTTLEHLEVILEKVV